jgi:phosphoserine phosphatase RsbU/P
MRILIAWDEPHEAELITLFLNAAENHAISCLAPYDVRERAESEPWDVVLLAVTFPQTAEQGFTLFRQLQHALPGVPVVVGYRSREIFDLPRFLRHGLRFYLNRDREGNFIFLVLSCLSSAVEATRSRNGSRPSSHPLAATVKGPR